MLKKIVSLIMLSVFILGTVSACVPPGQIRKQLTPGHLKKGR